MYSVVAVWKTAGLVVVKSLVRISSFFSPRLTRPLSSSWVGSPMNVRCEGDIKIYSANREGSVDQHSYNGAFAHRRLRTIEMEMSTAL